MTLTGRKSKVNLPMASDLSRAVERLHVGVGLQEDECVDDILSLPRPWKKIKRDSEALKKELEQQFMTPPLSLGENWLNKLQQYVRGKPSMTYS